MLPGSLVRLAAVRRRPGLWFDLPVALLLILCWMTIPLVVAHLVTGLLLTVVLVLHLCTRRTLFPRRRTFRPVVAAAILLAAAALTLLTGLLRWAGMPREVVFHAVPSYSLVAFAIWHVVRRRRALLARIRPRARR